MTTVQNAVQLNILLSSIEMRGTRFAEWRFGWRVTEVEGPGTGLDRMAGLVELLGWHVQCSFERPDANDGSVAVGYGRKWFVDVGTSETGVVFTAWLAIQQIVIHELHESFTVTVEGERVRLLDPHKRLADLAAGSRRL